MKSLVSLKDCYEDFCAEFDIKIQSSNKNVIAGIAYGDSCDLPVRPRQVVFLLDNNSDAEKCLPVLQYAKDNAKYAEYSFVAVINRKKQRNLFENWEDVEVYLANTPEAVAALAVSGFVLTERSLPAFFVRRKGQKVASFFDSEKQKKVENDILNRSTYARSLIQTTDIIIDSEARKAFLETAFDIEEIGCGHIAVIPEDETYKKNLTEYLLENDRQISTVKVCEYGKQSRKKVLLSVKWGADLRADNTVKTLSDLLVTQGYKVYLLLQRPEDLSKISGIKTLNRNVLILFQGWVFSKGRQELVDIRYILSNLFLFEDVSAALTKLKEKGMERECRRLFGGAEFESFIYIGNINRLLLAVTTGVSAKKRIKMEVEAPSSSQCRYQQRNNGVQIYNNITKVVNQLFDKIVFPNSQFAEEAKESERYSVEKVQVYYCRKVWKNPDMENAWEEIGLSKRQYVIYENEESFVRNKEMKLLPLPEKGRKTFLVHSEMMDVTELVRRFSCSELCIDGAQLFVFGNEANTAWSEGCNMNIAEQIIPIGGVYLENIPFPKRYMKLFTGYLFVDEEDENIYCPIRLGMEFVEGRVFKVREDGSVSESKISVFHDLSEYDTACKKELLSLLG